ncbi:helix-turn-helix domain-containing protein [Mechercharimyces sp. CAU 1602]|uniref:helix-turn-helix domain-containing protein n=1 Tax=Mechercharimyces sp. CAU 1602 TaxID=2973933 RepID=UPI0021622CC9|nr:helix-turn-helix domain-containing protein [Mechercharimyces sp. CAU 1602]MCS1351786.1 helix-turn-helix domain-containing protein [Mechercharimyces sp. CAU 1602]
MSKETYITTAEAASQLHVHARTIRKWIDTFAEYIQPETNERGHYLLTQSGLERLEEIQRRLQEKNRSMRQVRELLKEEGKIRGLSHPSNLAIPSPPHLPPKVEATMDQIMESMTNMEKWIESLTKRMERIEDHVFDLFDALEEVEHRIHQSNHEYAKTEEVSAMFEEIRRKQDQLKIELRQATFSHRLAAAAVSPAELGPRKQKKGSRFLLF